MEENLVGTDSSAYSYPHMLQKLKEHFGENIILAEINGKPNVLTFVNKPRLSYMTFIIIETSTLKKRSKE